MHGAVKLWTNALMSFDEQAHPNTWNSRNITPTLFPSKDAFGTQMHLTCTDGSVESVRREDSLTTT